MVKESSGAIGRFMCLDACDSCPRENDDGTLGRCGSQWEDRLLSACCRNAVYLDTAAGVVNDEAWDWSVFGWLCLVHDIVTCCSREGCRSETSSRHFAALLGVAHFSPIAYGVCSGFYDRLFTAILHGRVLWPPLRYDISRRDRLDSVRMENSSGAFRAGVFEIKVCHCFDEV